MQQITLFSSPVTLLVIYMNSIKELHSRLSSKQRSPKLQKIWGEVWTKNARYHSPALRFSKTIDKINNLILSGVDFKNKKILDIGCGDGTTLRYLYDMYAATGQGIDVSIEAISKSTNLSRSYPLSFMISDTRNLPFKEFSFDIILSWGVIEHFKEDLLSLAQYYKVLKPSGTLILIQPNILSSAVIQEKLLRYRNKWPFGMHTKYLPSHWQKALERLGFTNIHMFTRPPYQDMPPYNIIDLYVKKIFPFWGHYLYIIANR